MFEAVQHSWMQAIAQWRWPYSVALLVMLASVGYHIWLVGVGLRGAAWRKKAPVLVSVVFVLYCFLSMIPGDVLERPPFRHDGLFVSMSLMFSLAPWVGFETERRARAWGIRYWQRRAADDAERPE